MSQKNNSLAIDEILFEEQFQPQLSIIVNLRNGMGINGLASDLTTRIDDVVSISGKVTVSF